MRRFLSRLPSLAPLCFFLISVSYKLAWTAISSLLSQYSKSYGPGILLQLNVAYFFPSIPVLILQTALNDRMDRRLGLPTGALLRFAVGLGGLVALTNFFPQLTAGGERALLLTTVLVGVSYGIAFGTSYQMAAKYSSGATVALTTGFVSSGPVVLAMDLALKRGAYYTPAGLQQLFQWVAIVTAAGLVAAALLVLGSWRMLSAGAPPAHHHHHNHHRIDVTASHRTSSPPTQSSYYGNGKDVAVGITGGAAAVHAPERAAGPYVRHRTDTATAGGAGGWDASGGVGMGPGGNGFHHHGYPHQQHGGHPGGHHAITFDFVHDGHLGSPHQHHQGAGAGYGADKGAGHPGAHHDQVAIGYNPTDLSADESKVAKRDVPLLRLAVRILPAAVSITISVGTSMLVFPFFTYMHSTGLLGVRLAQVLFYIRLVGDIAGRMAPRRLQVTTVRKLMLWAAVKLAMVPLLFGCIFTPELVGGDVTSMVVVALFWVLSGYLNTCSYLVAPTLVPPSQKGRASGLMTVAFQSACFGALMLAAAIQRMDLGHHAAAAAHAVLSHRHGG